MDDLAKINHLLTIPNIVIDVEMRRVGDIILSNAVSYDIPDVLKDLKNGLLFMNKHHEPYTNTLALRTYLNGILKKANQGTISDVIKILHPKQPQPQIIFTLNDIVIVQPQVDPHIAKLLSGWGIYMVKNDTNSYPFIVIENPDGTISRYDIYRYAAGLPIFTRLTNEYRLPTVDHINRNTHDTTTGHLRYCTLTQNAWNKCRLGVSCIHNVDQNANGKKWVVTLHAPPMPLRICETWCTLFCNANLDDIHGIYGTNTSMFSNESCQNRLIKTIPHIGTVNAFVRELLDLISTPGIETYEMDGVKIKPNTIPTCHYTHRPILSMLYNSAPPIFNVTASYDDAYIPALIVDLCKLQMHGEYAHTNMLRVPKPKNTVASYSHDKTPIDILNYFGKYRNIEEDDIMYHYDIKIVDGLKRIVALSVPKCITTDLSEFDIKHNARTTEIVSPFTLYNGNKKDNI
jgi:hypothetical protein